MIITEYHQYKTLLERMNRDECVLTPIFRDPYYHRVENAILCVGITFTNLDTYIVSISHDDAPTFEVPSGDRVFTERDVAILAYINNLSIPTHEFDTYIVSTQQQFQIFRHTNKLIPIAVWSRHLRAHNTELIRILNTHRSTLHTTPYELCTEISNTLQEIEAAGLKIDVPVFEQHFDSKTKRYFTRDMVYSEYNIFTTTGRPSNRFGGINYAALNKTDGRRAAFISRHRDGLLVQFDFEAYHLRLIADEYGISLPTDSLHTELAKKYFNTDEITDELYMAGKQKTFEIIYGMSDETYGVPLFEHLIKRRNSFTNIVGTLTLPSGISVNFTEPNPSKAFNYYVQSLEIVKTMPKLRKVLELLRPTPHKLVLYTYDSILLDMQTFDVEIINTIRDILEENKKFPVRIHAGNTYNELVEIPN